MFFQSFTKRQMETVIKKDLYDQLQHIVVTILSGEVTNHFQANHILYSANIQLAELKEIASYHRKNINMHSEVGQFHKDAYDMTIKKANQLQLIIDSYVTLHIDLERERINHRLRFLDDKVVSLYNELIEFKNQTILPQLEESYWGAYKTDLMPILAELR
ncbi:hypothetical protein SAMN05877842_102238 [Ureibacillus acetophenoni]|uniref:Uncharacterized protein n=2 Tax=Ureibacillus acetophenoni TaxID=614649 RepID=A0A285U3A8_9BACL|nr:hypothetical protein SAMN05877842_102238 [Ureibacillus acetophenoni]